MPNTNNPLISIVTVCFNSEKTIAQTIESVLNQTYSNIEYILIDGKSTDNTLNIINRYSEQFKQKNITYKVISEPDNGIYDAMNKGVKLATGEWVGIINSDDWYEFNACKKVVNYQENNIDVLYGICATYSLIANNYELTGVMQASPESMYHYNYTFAHPATFIRKHIYQVFNYSSVYKMAADLNFFITLYKQKCGFKFIPYILANFRTDGSSHKYKYLTERETLKIRYKHNIINLRYYLLKLVINFIKRIMDYQ